MLRIESAPRRLAALGFAGLMAMAAVPCTAAEDRGGLQDFFRSMFGGQQATAPAYERPADTGATLSRRPLTVRLHKPKIVFAAHPTKPEKVSIYADRTLRRGDAVMMADGIRVFSGSSSWPYTDADFISLAKARDISRTTGEVLAAMDRAPRG